MKRVLPIIGLGFRHCPFFPLFFIAAMLSFSGNCQIITKYPPDRDARWRADIDYFASELPVRQKDFSLLVSEDQFAREVTELKRQVPQLSDADIILRLSRITAKLGVAMTSAYVGTVTNTMALKYYPIRFRWFPEGLAVVAAAPQYQGALGARVLRIGTLTPQQVEAIVAPYISHENTNWLRHESPRYMTLVDLMQREKIAGRDGHLQLTCAPPGGKPLLLDIDPHAPGRLQHVTDVLHIPMILCRHPAKAPYWYEYLPKDSTLYIQYSKCTNDPASPFADFVSGMLAFADSHPIERVVIDLRFNQGGDSRVVKPLIDGLKSRVSQNSIGRVYTLTGDGTFGAAMWAAFDCRTQLQSVLVGEPTGSKPNHHGRPIGQPKDCFLLPNSKLAVAYTTVFFRLIPDDDPLALQPDIFVPNTLKDFLAGRDQALEMAVHPISR